MAKPVLVFIHFSIY